MKLCSPVPSCLLLLTSAFGRGQERRIPDIRARGLPEDSHSINYSRSLKVRTSSPWIPKSNSTSDCNGIGVELLPGSHQPVDVHRAYRKQGLHPVSLEPFSHLLGSVLCTGSRRCVNTIDQLPTSLFFPRSSWLLWLIELFWTNILSIQGITLAADDKVS